MFAYLVLVTRASILNKEICSNLICSLTVVIGAFGTRQSPIYTNLLCCNLWPTSYQRICTTRSACRQTTEVSCIATLHVHCVYSRVQKLLKPSCISTPRLHNHTACFSSKRLWAGEAVLCSVWIKQKGPVCYNDGELMGWASLFFPPHLIGLIM